jgi:DNA-binding beta-propeller fold protein YncE
VAWRGSATLPSPAENHPPNTPGKPIHIGTGIFEIAIAPDGRTLYAAALNKVIPISTATNTPGKPIRPVRTGYPREIVIAP